MYSALTDFYGKLHLIPNAQNISLKSWWVGKICIEHGWFQKNDYHKIKIIWINKKFKSFFISIDCVSKSLIIFQKNK
jgi:hypothetical protein